MPNVAFIRPELSKLFPQYYLIRDAIAGEPTVKAARDKYLPRPNAADTSAENKARYDAYIERAVFYNVSRRTLAGLVGQVYMVDPEIELPASIANVEVNVDGKGVTLVQQSKQALSTALAYSRGGLFVDYPETDGVVTASQKEEGTIRATINLYGPTEVVNWRVVEDGAIEKLSLVVLLETFVNADDGFEIKTAAQFRVLRLDDAGEYVQEIWREPQPTNADGSRVPKGKNFQQHKVIKPRGPDGKPLRELPFQFFGSENNDPSPDNPNFYDLASLNIAHYRNSADYEESCYIVGQPTPVVIGLTQDWLDNVLKGVINFGSRGGIPLPVGASIELLQATENTMIFEAMETKERQMVALGAKLVEQKAVQRTAFETKVEATGEGSILSSTTHNIQAAYEWALKICAMFEGDDGATIKFELNTDFDIAKLTPEEQAKAIDSWQKGAITFTEMRGVLRRAGVATEDDEAAKEAIAADQADALRVAAEAMDAMNPTPTLDANGDPMPKAPPKKPVQMPKNKAPGLPKIGGGK
jgi:hypothetical protein